MKRYLEMKYFSVIFFTVREVMNRLTSVADFKERLKYHSKIISQRQDTLALLVYIVHLGK